MKRFTIALSLLLVCLVFLVLGSDQIAFGQGAGTGPISGGGDMPGRPLPATPIPHHEPGHPARGMDYSTQVERINAEGVKEPVQLTSLDAMLADGVIDDPLQGNYRLVTQDKLMWASYHDLNDLTLQTFELVTPTPPTPTLNAIPDSEEQMGNHRFYDIAAGDLNGDGIDEQISAWIGDGNQIYLSTGEMPNAAGSMGRVTSSPAIVSSTNGPEVVVRGYDDALWYRDRIDETFWQNAGGRLLSAPAIVSQGNGQSTAFAIGTDNQVFSTHLIKNRALGLDGVDDYVVLPDNFPNVTAFTFTAWVNWKGGQNWQRIFDFGQDTNSNMFLTPSNGTNTRFAITTGGSGAEKRLDSTTPLVQNDWVHVAVTLDGTTGVLYVNGNAVDTQPISLTPKEVVGMNNWLGKSQYADPYFNGFIDEVAVFDRALSGAEIATIYQSGWDSMSGKILGLHLEENPAIDSTILADASGQDHQGTLHTSEGNANKSVSRILAANWQPVEPSGDDWLPVEAWQGPTPELPAPAVVARDGQLDLFRIGPDNTLRWQHSDDGTTWQAWQNLGGMLASGPGVISLWPDHMQVFARGVDDALWTLTYNGGNWVNWQRIDRDGMPDGVTIASAPAVVSPAANQLLVVVRGSDDQLWQLTNDGSSWDDWQPAAGIPGDVTFASAPALVTQGGQIELFSQTVDGHLGHALYNGSSWTDWADLEGLPVGDVYPLDAWTVQPPGNDSVENWLLDIETGHFTGDGREQIVLAYRSPDGIRIELYDIEDGFRPVKIAELSSPINDGWVPKIATGDANGDGIDEIGLVYIPDDKHYQLKVFDFAYDSERVLPGTLTQSYDSGPVWAENYVFGGTLKIVAGDIVPDPHSPNDEFAVVSDWYHRDGDRDQLITRISLYDDNRDPKFDGKFFVFYQATDETNGDEYQTGIGLAVGDVDGPQQGYGIDEIVVTWPRGFDGNDWPDLERNLVVYGWDAQGSGLVEKRSYEIPGYSRYSYLDTLAVGDLDQDLKDEIVMVSHQGGKYIDRDYYLDVYEYETLSSGPIVHGEVFRGSAYNLAMGDFTGDSVRVGPPSYRRQHDVGQVTAVVNAPPKHEDTVDGVPYNLNADDAATYSQFKQVTGNSTEVSVTTQKDWSVNSKFKHTIGDPDATHVTTSIKNSYGENFENTGSSTQSLTYQQSIQAITDDVLYYTRLDYDVWEYPVYDRLTNAPQGYMSVVWPVGSMQSVVEPANSCNGWYMPNHQLMNVWSYPSTADQLLDRDESNDLQHDVPLYTIGTEQVDFSVDFDSVDTERRSHKYDLGFAGSFESQIGGEEVGVDLGVVSYSTRMPSLYFSTSSEYNQSELSEWQTTTTKSTTLSGFFDPIPKGVNRRYTVRPYLYWSDNDYLVLDYVTDPSEQAFWSSSGAVYNRPDPAFIRPWAEGQCNHVWPDAEYFTSDITIDPPMAKAGEPVTITATLRNFSEVGNGNAPFNQPFKVEFYQGDPDAGGNLIGHVDIAVGELKPRTEKAVITRSISWLAEGSGEQHIYAVIDPEDALVEVHDENDPDVNNNKGYGVLSMNTTDFIDAGQADEKVYYAVTLPLGDAEPISSLYVPLHTISENLRIDMQTSVEFGSLHSLGSAFDIIPYQTDWDNPEPDFNFTPDKDDPPAVIILDYTGVDLTGFDENSLMLYRYDGTDWKPANHTCGVDNENTALYDLQRFPDDDRIAVPVCRTGTFVLATNIPVPQPPTATIYLPLVKNAP